MNKEHINELDVLRVIGFVLVVAQHVFGAFAWRDGAGFAESLFLSLLFVIAQPAVPLFIMIVAMSLFYNYSKKMSILDFYKKRFLYIFLPYVVWTILNILDAKQYGEASFGYFFGQLAAGTGRYHLWYMSMVLRIYLFFPLILWGTKRLLTLSRFYKVCFFIAFSMFYIILLKSNNEITAWIGNLIFGITTLNQQRFIERTPLLWSIYFVMGAYVIFGYPQFIIWIRKCKKYIILLYVPLLFYNYYVEISPHLPGHIYVTTGYLYCLLKISFMVMSMFVAYSLSCYVTEQKPRLYRLMQKTSTYSYSAYLGHVIVLQAVYMKYSQLIPIKSMLVSAIIIFLLTIVITLKLMELLSILPFSKYFLGTKNKYYPKWLGKKDTPLSVTERG